MISKGRTTDDPDNFEQTCYGDNKVEHSRRRIPRTIAGIAAAAEVITGMKGFIMLR